MSTLVLRSIRDRATFRGLRSGRRARRGLVSVSWLPPDPAQPATAPRVAFAIGRGVGGAVVRNRIRRRLRAAMTEMPLPAGAYLVSAGRDAATAPWPQLRRDLATAVRACTEPS